MISLTYQQKPRNSQSKRGFNVGVVVKFLKLLKKEMYFHQIFCNGPLRHKASFLKYLKWLMKHGLIVNRIDYHVKIYSGLVRKSRKKAAIHPHSFYKTTAKGRKFLELLS